MSLKCSTTTRMLPSVRHIISGKETEVVVAYKYLGLQVDDRPDWSINTDYTYKCSAVQSRLYSLRRLASLNVCKRTLPSSMGWCVGEVAPNRGTHRGWTS